MHLDRTEAIAAVASGQSLERLGGGQYLFGPTTLGADLIPRPAGTIKHRHLIACLPENTGQIEQA